MRIKHRLAVDESLFGRFAKIGIELAIDPKDRANGLNFVTPTFYEDQPEWPRVGVLVKRHKILDVEDTDFSDAEISESRWLSFKSTSFTGFPEPSEDSGYLGVSFDLSNTCEKCGVGRRQVAPIRIAREPKWGRRQTFQLHWLFDEIFVHPETWARIFEPFGVDRWPVHSRGGKVLESVVQLKFEQECALHLPADLAGAICRKCRRRKYMPHGRGFEFQPSRTDLTTFRSSDWFGDGGEASRLMYVNQELGKAMRESNLNCQYRACLL